MSFVRRPQFRAGLAFWLFGLVNNVLYVIILSAAVDLVPPSVPKSVVLFADNFPAFVAKLSGPYFIHLIPYGGRLWILAAMSALAMFSVAAFDSITLRLLAVGIASAASGWGEMSFLSLTHFFPGGNVALAAFSSGTGAAGLVGAGAYAVLTSAIGLSSRSTIYASSFLPLIQLVAYFIILPQTAGLGEYEHVAQSDVDTDDQPDERSNLTENETLAPVETLPKSGRGGVMSSIRETLARTGKLVYPYMLPLFIVYTAEYTAISGIAPTLLFPLDETPFGALRDFYPAYNAIYQVGVFISRSSILFFRLKNIYTPSILQSVNAAVLLAHAFLYFLPSVWIVFAIYFWTGLLGGAVYVNSYAKITDEVPEEDREFSLGTVSVADTLGILLASFVSMPLEPAICAAQVRQGRDWCKQI